MPLFPGSHTEECIGLTLTKKCSENNCLPEKEERTLPQEAGEITGWVSIKQLDKLKSLLDNNLTGWGL